MFERAVRSNQMPEALLFVPRDGNWESEQSEQETDAVSELVRFTRGLCHEVTRRTVRFPCGLLQVPAAARVGVHTSHGPALLVVCGLQKVRGQLAIVK